MSFPIRGFSVACGLTEPYRITCTHRITGDTETAEFDEPFIFFGRHPQNTAQLDDPSVSKKHAYLQVIDGHAFLVDFGSRTGIRVDGNPIVHGWVNPGQSVEIGEYNVQIVGLLKAAADRPLSTTAVTAPSLLQLAISNDPASQGSVVCPLHSPMTLIGRHPQCNFRLLDERLNFFHLSVVQTANDVWLIDLPGSGGTRLNERLVRSSVLQVGDRINLNGIYLDVQLNRYEMPRNSAMEPVSNKMGRFSSASEELQPIADQVNDLRQATMLMASLFAEMKREQSTLMQRQIELMEVMTQAFRDSRPPPVAIPIAPTTATPTSIPVQVPRMPKPEEESTLAQAHAWFLSRLDKLGKPS